MQIFDSIMMAHQSITTITVTDKKTMTCVDNKLIVNTHSSGSVSSKNTANRLRFANPVVRETVGYTIHV